MLVVGEELDREEREPPRLEQPAELARRDVELHAARARRSRSRRGTRSRSCVRRGSSAAGARPPRRAGRAGTRRAAARRRASPRARAGSPPRRAPRARGRSTRRAPCRRGTAAAACRARRARPARSSGSSSPRTTKRPCSNGSSSSRGSPTAAASSGVHVYVSPSTPSVSASCADASPPSGERELAQHVFDRLLDDLAVALAPGHDPGVEVRRGEDGVVVEHLLEVRDEPAVVDRVAVEAASDDVVEPARGHPVERRGHHRERRLVPAAQEELEGRRGRELRRAAEAAERRLERRGDPRAPPRASKRRGQRLGRRLRAGRRAQRAVDPRRLRARCRRGARARSPRPRAAAPGSSGSRGAARAGSTCRRRTASPRAS